MEVALTGDSLACTADGVRLPAMRRCSEIFASLFEEPKGGKTAQRRSLRRKGSVLDANLAEVRQLEKKMGSEDKGRMDQYLTSVREAEIRTRRADVWLDTPLPKIADADRQRTNRDIAATKAGDYFRTVYDLMVLAFQTDTTRVATFSLGGEGAAFAIPVPKAQPVRIATARQPLARAASPSRKTVAAASPAAATHKPAAPPPGPGPWAQPAGEPTARVFRACSTCAHRARDTQRPQARRRDGCAEHAPLCCAEHDRCTREPAARA